MIHRKHINRTNPRVPAVGFRRKSNFAYMRGLAKYPNGIYVFGYKMEVDDSKPAKSDERIRSYQLTHWHKLDSAPSRKQRIPITDFTNRIW